MLSGNSGKVEKMAELAVNELASGWFRDTRSYSLENSVN